MGFLKKNSKDVELHPNSYNGARRQCAWPDCGRLETTFGTGCPTHGITGPPDVDDYDQAGKKGKQ